MKQKKTAVHFTDAYLLNPTNPITINLIGAGGTGSQMLTALSRINHSLLALGHPGLYLRLFDDDIVTTANLGRQLFATSELGSHKSAALIARVNRFFGTNWKSYSCKYDQHLNDVDELTANMTITCVDTAKGRFEIADILSTLPTQSHGPNCPIYWMDLGNSRHTGQVFLSTIKTVQQPKSKLFLPVPNLPAITTEFAHLLMSADDSNQPSCSLSEAITKQDLFINSAISTFGASLLWNLFREGMIHYRGFFMNLKQYSSNPIAIAAAKN